MIIPSCQSSSLHERHLELRADQLLEHGQGEDVGVDFPPMMAVHLDDLTTALAGRFRIERELGAGGRRGAAPPHRCLDGGYRTEYNRIMSGIRIIAVREPLAEPFLARKAVTTIGRAAAMGLLPENEVVETLDLPALKTVARYIGKAGVAPRALAELAAWTRGTPERLSALLDEVDQALIESPVPDREWREPVRILGEPLLAELVGVSRVSLRRYAAGQRDTPDPVAARLHHLALVVGSLAGSYNDYGIRRWFERKRVPLKDRTPREVLRGNWSPDATGPRQVLTLAESLLGSPVT
jgi:hypothetical protein